MLLEIPSLLTPQQLKAVDNLLSGGTFVDGRLSAGMAAEQVKTNEELAPRDHRHKDLNTIVMNTLVQHPTYQAATLPLRVATPFYARYTPGMAYGEHVDDPVMGAPERYRSDISVTIFLNAPDDYDGGELAIHTSFGLREVKLAAGDAVLYPSSSLHRVNEVTRGERRVAVTWVQSMVRDAQQRELLYELGIARDALLAADARADAARRVDRAWVNLLRMWAEV